MEDCYIYNKIIKAIEDNIHKEDREIYGLAASAAGLSRREAALLVKSVEGEDYNRYIKRRKIIRCAQHKLLNNKETWQDIAAEFAIFEYSTFNRRFKAILGVTPDDFLQRFEGDVMEMKPGYISKDNVVVMTETQVKTETETVFIEPEPGQLYVKHSPDGTHLYAMTPVGEEPERPEPDDENAMGKMLKDEFKISVDSFTSPEEQKKHVMRIVTSDPDTNGLLHAYNTLIELEDIRAIYGLTFEEVLYFYLQCGKRSSALYERCEYLSDRKFEEEMAELIDDEPDWDEWEREFYNDEMNLTEAYAYYQGEDEMKFDNEEPDFENNSIRHLYY